MKIGSFHFTVSKLKTAIGLGLVITQPLSPALAAQNCGPEALGTFRSIAISQDDAPVIGLKTYPRTLDLADHEVALTFDDGPNPGTTDKILAALRAECVRATFFLIGRNAAAHPALVKAEITDGHSVGHHSLSHPGVTLRGLPMAQAEAEIERGMKADDLAGYGTDSNAPRVQFFRFPGFADTPELLDYLKSRHIAVFGTDLWASDWQKMTPDAELKLVMSRLEETHGGIVLFHDTKASTAAMMPMFIKALKEQKFKVVALVPGPGPTALRQAPAGWTSQTEQTLAHILPKLMDAKAKPASKVPPMGGMEN